MIHQIPSYIFLAVIIAFIYFVNSINLKKNRAIHARSVMLHLKAKYEENPDGISAEEIEKAIEQYTACAESFNEAISSSPGALLNVILRYPRFETEQEHQNN